MTLTKENGSTQHKPCKYALSTKDPTKTGLGWTSALFKGGSWQLTAWPSHLTKTVCLVLPHMCFMVQVPLKGRKIYAYWRETRVQVPYCTSGMLKNNTNVRQITGIQEKLNTTCK